ncbi:MAG: hypothetical protein Q9160_008584 [Pyrenula sp. 1 TL-2023]
MEQNPPSIDTRLPYRIGCPQLPALPLETEFFSYKDVNFPTWRAHCDSIQDILRKYKICACARPAYRFHRETSAEKHPTWLILPDIDQTENGIDVWRQAAKDIWKQQQDLNLSVEILDLRAYQGLTTKPILSSEAELLAVWDNVMFRIATTVIKRGHDLKTLDLVHRERRGADTSIATVAITAKDADSNQRWYITIEALYEFLPPSLRVEIRYGSSVVATGPSETNSSYNVISLAHYSTNVSMGSSCGRIGLRHSGSLGGVIRLKGMEETFTLTNHHVMCIEDTELHSHGEQSDTKYITLKDKIAKLQTIMAASPSDEDHETFIKTLKSEQKTLLEDKTQQVYLRGQDHPHIKRLEENIQRRNDDILFANDFDRRFGWVVASSGTRSTPLPEVEYPNISIQKSNEGFMAQWVLDWSLIRVADNRKFLAAGYQPGHSYPISAQQYQSISRYKHYNVAKCGRTSGWTEGIISAARCLLTDSRPTDRPEMYPAVLDWDTGPGFGYTGLGVGYTVLPRDKETPFLEAGDSGSFVLLDRHTDEGAGDKMSDREKSIVGLGFGHNPAYNISYMMSMETVVKDIEEITEQKVEQPSYAGDAPDTKEHLAKD